MADKLFKDFIADDLIDVVSIEDTDLYYVNRGGDNFRITGLKLKELLDVTLTDAEVKTKYENNANTNAFTDVAKDKVEAIKTTENLTPPVSGTITVTLDNPQTKDYTGTATALEVYSVDTTPANLALSGNSKYLYNGTAHPTVTGATWLKSLSSYDIEVNHISGQDYYLVFANQADGIFFWLVEKTV